MRKILAIGGGNIGRDDKRINTTLFDREIIQLTGKKNPKLLFVPTATAGCNIYCEAIYKQFSKKLGCTVDILLLINKDPISWVIQDKIGHADIIYVGEGNTYQMMKYWRKHGVDKIMKTGLDNGAVLCGSSAGSIAWFHAGLSDSWKSEENPKKLIKVNGLNYIDALICPHYDTEIHRQLAFKKLLKRTRQIGIALDDLCAIEIIGNKFRILSVGKDAIARKMWWEKGSYKEIVLPKNEFYSLDSILSKYAASQQLSLVI